MNIIKKIRVEYLLPCIMAVVVPLIVYGSLLHYLSFSEPSMRLLDYLNSGPLVAQSPQAGNIYSFNIYWLFWLLLSVFKLNILSINVLPKLILGFICIISSYFYFRCIILKGTPIRLKANSMIITLASLFGSIVYFFGISSFDLWAGIAVVYAFLPLFGFLVLLGYQDALKHKLLFLLVASFIWMLVVVLYPLAILTYLLPLLINYLILVSERKKKLLPFLYIIATFFLMMIFAYPVVNSYLSSNVTNPEVLTSLSQVGRKIFLNSGNTITNLLVALPDPWISELVHNTPTIFFAIEFLIPIFAFGYLLFPQKNTLSRKLGFILAIIAVLIILLYTTSFTSLQGQPLLLIIGAQLPRPLSTIAVNLLGEFRIPEQTLPLIYSILSSFTVCVVLSKIQKTSEKIRLFSMFRVKILSAALVFLMIVTIGFSSYSLYVDYSGTGINAAATVNNSDIAVSDYILQLHPSGSVIWIPQPPQFQFLLYGGSNLITYVFGSDGPSSTWYLDYVISTTSSLLTKGKFDSVAIFLAQIGIEYVAVNSLSTIHGSVLLNSTVFTLVYRSGDSFLFRNNYYLKSWASNSVLYVSGGLNTYEQAIPYFNAINYTYTNPVTYYLDREPLPNLRIANGAFLFSQTSNIYDVVVPLLPQIVTIAPSKYASQTQGPWQAWTSNSVTDVGLTGLPWNKWITDDPLYEWQYTYQLNYGLAYTTTSASLTIPLALPVGGEYSILIRYLVSSQSKGLNVNINGQSYELKGNPIGVSGFVWKAIPVTLNKGDNSFVITSAGGLEAVNLVEVVEQNSLNQAIEEANKLMSSASQLYILNINQNSSSLLDFSFISSGTYSIFVNKQDIGLIDLTFQSTNSSIIAHWTGNNTGVFEMGSANLQNYLHVKINSSKPLNATTVMLFKSLDYQASSNYTVLVDPVLFSFPYKTITIGNYTLAAYPAFGMSTSFILPINTSSAAKIDLGIYERYPQA